MYFAHSSSFRPWEFKVTIFRVLEFVSKFGLSFRYFSVDANSFSECVLEFVDSIVVCLSCDSLWTPEKTLPGLTGGGL